MKGKDPSKGIRVFFKRIEREAALEEFQRTRDVLQLHRRLGNKYLSTTGKYIEREVRF